MAGYSKWIEASRDDLVRDVAERSLRSRLDAVGHFLPLAALRAGESVEYVHQLRVWSRRATAAIRLYRDLLPWNGAGRVKKQLTRIRRAAGQARDEDVLLMRLAEDPHQEHVAGLLETVRTQRNDAQLPLVQLYEQLEGGDRFQRLADKLICRLREIGESHPLRSVRFDIWASESLRPYVIQFFHDGKADLSDLKALHRFRISGKQLRYTMELLASAFPARFTKRLYLHVESLQERLGAINDLATGQQRYERWLEATDKASEAEYLRARLAAETDRLGNRHETFLGWWTPPRVRRLAREFEEIMKLKKRSRP